MGGDPLRPSKHCHVLGATAWGSQGWGTAPSCARSTNPEGGSQGSQLQKDGPISRTHHEHHLLPQLLLWARGVTPRARRKAGLWQAPACGNQGSGQLPEWSQWPDPPRADWSALRRRLLAEKGPAVALSGLRASRPLPAHLRAGLAPGDQQEAGPGRPSTLTLLGSQELRASTEQWAKPLCTAHLWKEASSLCSLGGASTEDRARPAPTQLGPS